MKDIKKYLRYYKITKMFQYKVDVIMLLIYNYKPTYTLGDAIIKLKKSELNYMINNEFSNNDSWYNIEKNEVY